jgi:FtsP/CotA-like multicopper oxidase with cupredoxin domain
MRSNAAFRTARLLLGGLAAVAAVAAILAQAALAVPQPPSVPGLSPDDGSRVFLVTHGVGVQIYACNGVAWSFVAPRADLFTDNGQLVIHHFGGPSWEARDGSTVVGTVVNKATPDQSAVPWLLLSAKPAQDSKPGRLAHTSFIQRINTIGGIQPPAADCNAAAAGTQVEVPYTADYVFWK